MIRRKYPTAEESIRHGKATREELIAARDLGRGSFEDRAFIVGWVTSSLASLTTSKDPAARNLALRTLAAVCDAETLEDLLAKRFPL